MEIKILKPRKAINKAFLKIKPSRTEIESFKINLIQLLGIIIIIIIITQNTLSNLLPNGEKK